MIYWIAALAVAGAVLYALGVRFMNAMRESGAHELAAQEAIRDKETAKRQAEIMLEERTTDETADRLDRGEF